VLFLVTVMQIILQLFITSFYAINKTSVVCACVKIRSPLKVTK